SAARQSASSAIPPFPGAQNNFSTRLDCRNFHTRACSRPPLPMTSTFMMGTSRLGVTGNDCQFAISPVRRRPPQRSKWYTQPCIREGGLQLRLESRPIGEVLVVQCHGRVVAGKEVFTLHSFVGDSFVRYPDVVLQLDHLEFVDSSGLGALVRLTQAA